MRRGIGGAIVGGVLGALALVAPASAAEDTEVVQGEYVRLVSVADWDRAAGMAPGESMRWDLEISADAPEPGTLAVAMSAAGETPLVIDAALCFEEWRGETCPGGAEDLRTDWAVPRDGDLVVLDEVNAADVVHVRLDIVLADAGPAASTEVRVHAIGAGEEIMTGPPEPLVPTGMPSSVPWVLIGGSVLLTGAAALLTVRSRRRASRSAS